MFVRFIPSYNDLYMWFLPLALGDMSTNLHTVYLFADPLVQVMLSRKGQYHLPWKHLQKHRAM